MPVIILIRRVAKKDCLEAFLERYEKERPRGKTGFITEYLTRVEGANMPVLRELDLLHPSADGIAFLNVAFWESEQDFINAFKPQPGYFEADTECEPRKRAVINIEKMAGGLPPNADV